MPNNDTQSAFPMAQREPVVARDSHGGWSMPYSMFKQLDHVSVVLFCAGDTKQLVRA